MIGQTLLTCIILKINLYRLGKQVKFTYTFVFNSFFDELNFVQNRFLDAVLGLILKRS